MKLPFVVRASCPRRERDVWAMPTLRERTIGKFLSRNRLNFRGLEISEVCLELDTLLHKKSAFKTLDHHQILPHRHQLTLSAENINHNTRDRSHNRNLHFHRFQHH
jgi:hypothetical protein